MKLIIFSLLFLVSVCSGVDDVIPTKDSLTKALKEVPELLVSLNGLFCKFSNAKVRQDNNELNNQIYKELKELLAKAGCVLNIEGEAGNKNADLTNSLEDALRKILDKLPITEDVMRLLCGLISGLTECIKNADLASTDFSAVIALLNDPSNTVNKVYELVDALGKTLGCTLTNLLSKDKLNQLPADVQKLVAGLVKLDLLKTLDINRAIDGILGKFNLACSLETNLGELIKNVLQIVTNLLSSIGR